MTRSLTSLRAIEHAERGQRAVRRLLGDDEAMREFMGEERREEVEDQLAVIDEAILAFDDGGDEVPHLENLVASLEKLRGMLADGVL